MISILISAFVCVAAASSENPVPAPGKTTETPVAVATKSDVPTTLEEIRQRIDQRLEKLRTLEAKVSMTMDTIAQKLESTGTVYLQRENSEEAMRMSRHIKYKSLNTSGELNMDLYVTDVSAYSVRTMNGETYVFNQPPNTILTSPNGRKMLEMVTAKASVVVMPPEKVGERDAFALLAEPDHTDTGRAYSRAALYIDMRTGVTLKLVGLDDAGKEVMVVEYSDLKINEPIDPEKFKFTMPEGAKFMQMGGPVGG